MSGFASLLSQFKETTQAAAAASSSSSNGGGGKRSRTSFEQSSSIQQPHHQLKHKQIKISSESNYCYPSSAPVKTIYIACPANAETGGPEALHQLCHMINSGEYYFHDDTDTTNAKEGDEAHDEFGRLITDKSSSKQNKVDKGERQLKAFMLYLRERSSGNVSSVEQVFADRSPRPSKYDKYNAPIVEHQFPSHHPPNDSTSVSLSNNNGGYSSDLVIWPEVWTHLIDALQLEPSLNAAKYQSAIWWLSVNNNKGRFAPQQFLKRRDILHLVQSSYARDYVRSKLSAATSGNGVGSGAKKDNKQEHVLTMTEFIPYTSSEFSLPLTPATKGVSKEQKLNLVVYNPAKGMHWTDEIIRRACGKQAKTERDGSVTSGGGIRFCPIGKGLGGRERMTGEEVVELLKTAKVYIDFGPHPGMDRLPREAALAGCVVITNREGAANFDDDVPLPSEFKFAQFNVGKIFSLIKDCCATHDEYAKKLETYKEWILDQRVQMKACVDEMINEVATKRIDCKSDE